MGFHFYNTIEMLLIKAHTQVQPLLLAYAILVSMQNNVSANNEGVVKYCLPE